VLFPSRLFLERFLIFGYFNADTVRNVVRLSYTVLVTNTIPRSQESYLAQASQ
jgi:hypothetical protein